jgi:hypothetical protein
MVENSFIDPSCAIVFSPIIPNPLGPIITPEIIKPIIFGIRAFRNIIGDSKIIKSNKENNKTGFFSGN